MLQKIKTHIKSSASSGLSLIKRRDQRSIWWNWSSRHYNIVWRFCWVSWCLNKIELKKLKGCLILDDWNKCICAIGSGVDYFISITVSTLFNDQKQRCNDVLQIWCSYRFPKSRRFPKTLVLESPFNIRKGPQYRYFPLFTEHLRRTAFAWFTKRYKQEEKNLK